MNTVTFWTYDNRGNLKSYHSFDDLELFLTGKTIGAAEPKFSSVEIQGGDGELDFTEYFGEIHYKNRTLSFEFASIIDPSSFLDQYSRLQNLFNGRKMYITLSDDTGFYYTGRVTVNEWKSNKRIGNFTIDVNAEPYKLKHAPTVIYRTIRVPTAITCHNSRKSVIPNITLTTSDASVTATFGNYTTEPFASVCPATFIFSEGENVVTITPTRESAVPVGVRIEYQEGEL